MRSLVAGGRQALLVYLPAAAALACDQLAKQWVRTHLPAGVPVVVAPHVNWFHVINKGGAFSLLYGNVWLLSLVSLGVAAGIVVFERRHPGLLRARAGALGILLGGTLGNLWDRVRFGEVTDFLDVYVGDHHWPTFNVADVCINLGVATLLLVTARERPTPSAPEKS